MSRRIYETHYRGICPQDFALGSRRNFLRLGILTTLMLSGIRGKNDPSLIRGNSTRTTKTLVFLPGLDGTGVFFQPLLESLPASLRSHVVCFPSYGSNEYEHLLKVARDAVARIPEFYVVAWSFSGPLALMLAASEPKKVRGIILFSSFIRAPLRFLSVFRFGAVAPVIWTVRACRRIPVWIRHSSCDPFRHTKAELWRRVNARVLAARVRAINAMGAHEQLRRCHVPILYIAASRGQSGAPAQRR